MSVSGITTSSFFDYESESVQNGMQQAQNEFQQLGQDLQSGNLSAAQSDLVTLQQLGVTSSSTSSSSSSSTPTNPVAQAYNQLAQDLQSGNLSAAQQDYATLQQDLQSQGAQPHHHHHHHPGDSGSDGNTISQLFDQLGQALQSGNLSEAQQAYSTLEQDFQQSSDSSSVSSLSTAAVTT